MIVDRHLLPTDPPWLQRAFKEIGVKEVDPLETARIVEYHAHTSLGATNDETPWCSSFCCFIMDTSGLTSTQSAASLSWLRWGRVLAKPERGCLVIFERLDRQGHVVPHRGHCGFWLGESDGRCFVLGGNQKNRVGVDEFDRARVLGYRWPSSAVNSSTNMATIGAGVGTAATAVPTVLTVLASDENAEKALTIWERLTSTPSTLLVIAGLFLTTAALWHIVKERNAKIKRLGV